MWTAFDYLYRDAGNFKAFGTVILNGALSSKDRKLIRPRLSSGEYFIAEQVDVAPLYEKLYEVSGGPTQSDHCWHEFVGLHGITAPNDASSALPASELVARFARVERWDESLSPHFSLAAVL